MKTEFDHELMAVVADDEVLARKRIRHLLAKRSDIRVVAECVHGYDVCDKVLEYKPDLLFLDIQMPEMDGLEVLRTLGPVAVPGVVFVTAFDQHAIRAFELHALDYLLKPFDDARFYEALDRAIQMIGKQQLPDNLKRLLQNLPRP
ncbi:MAG TPA: response regulator, partial [bacterium]|nr:response regulator [bacterium]